MPKYHVNQLPLFYDPRGQGGVGLPGPHDRASVQAVDASTEPATYTVIVLKWSGGKYLPQKPALTGVAESFLFVPDAEQPGPGNDL